MGFQIWNAGGSNSKSYGGNIALGILVIEATKVNNILHVWVCV